MVRGYVLDLALRQRSRVSALREDGADLAQSVVLELMQNAGSLRFRGPEAMRALAAEIFVRLASDRRRALGTQKRDCRRERRLPDNDEETGAGILARAAENPAELAAAHELLARYEARLARLNERERQVLRRRVAGEGHRSIAAALGISAALSQHLLMEARRKLGEP